MSTDRIDDKIKVVVYLVSGIFLFICALEGIGFGFKLMFSEWANAILSLVKSGVAPFTGLAIGILAATLMESSSAVVATTMVSMAGMVEAGLPIATAMRFGLPMVLGANVGTTAGNTITLFAIRRSTTDEEFNSTIPGVLVDDVYKLLTIIIVFPLELATGFLSFTASRIGTYLFELLRLETLLAIFEKTIIDIIITEPIVDPLGHLFSHYIGQRFGGIVFFAFWFVIVILSIDYLNTRGLKLLIKTDWAARVSAAFEHPVKSFATGLGITWLVGSSSIGTSLAIPMIATKMVTIEKAYPYLCGSNMGTTIDLAQIYGYMAGGLIGIMLGMALVILNTLALVIFLLSPLRIFPIIVANKIAYLITSKPYSQFMLVAYVILVFIIFPLMVIIFI